MNGDGNTICVGQPYVRVNDLRMAGVIRVYEKDGNAWNQKGGNIVGTQWASMMARCDLSSDGNRLIASATAGVDNRGYQRVFDYDDTFSNWVQRGATIVGQNIWTYSGYWPRISGNGLRLAIDDRYEKGDNRGRLKVYEFNDNENKWKQVGSDIIGEEPGEYLASENAISYDGNRVVVGAGLGSVYASGSYVKVFEYVSGSWNQLGSTILPKVNGKSASESKFGSAVDMTADGSRIVVGGEDYMDGGTDTAIALVWCKFLTIMKIMKNGNKRGKLSSVILLME